MNCLIDLAFLHKLQKKNNSKSKFSPDTKLRMVSGFCLALMKITLTVNYQLFSELLYTQVNNFISHRLHAAVLLDNFVERVSKCQHLITHDNRKQTPKILTLRIVAVLNCKIYLKPLTLSLQGFFFVNAFNLAN